MASFDAASMVGEPPLPCNTLYGDHRGEVEQILPSQQDLSLPLGERQRLVCMPDKEQPPGSGGTRKEQTKTRKDLILKMLVGLLDGMDTGREAIPPDFEEPPESRLEDERSALGRLAQLSQRDRKAPCKNFFWKTFTSC
nr:somatostatin-1B-like [Pelodiscus sinensis]|eukprot:XP_006127193.1 somatostatin-1B-like [Pelodiscus sinensis]